jgi:hypothetical protein
MWQGLHACEGVSQGYQGNMEAILRASHGFWKKSWLRISKIRFSGGITQCQSRSINRFSHTK